jgi:hypothetical protein
MAGMPGGPSLERVADALIASSTATVGSATGIDSTGRCSGGWLASVVSPPESEHPTIDNARITIEATNALSRQGPTPTRHGCVRGRSPSGSGVEIDEAVGATTTACSCVATNTAEPPR